MALTERRFRRSVDQSRTVEFHDRRINAHFRRARRPV